MVDIVAAKNNLMIHKKNLEHLENYNHLFSTFPFKQACAAQIKELKTLISNVEHNIRKHERRTGEQHGM